MRTIAMRRVKRLHLTSARAVIATLLGSHMLAAQATPADPAAAIASTEIARHLGVLARDSMQGRAVPGPGVDRTVRYITEQFEALGLLGIAPANLGADRGTRAWVQRYPMPGQTVYANGGIIFYGHLRRAGKWVVAETGEEVSATGQVLFGVDAHPAREVAEYRATLAEAPGAVLLAGPHTAATVAKAGVRGVNVFYVPPPGTDTATVEAVIRTLYQSNPGRGVIVVVDEDSAELARRVRSSPVRALRMVDQFMVGASATPRGWAVYTRADAVAPVLRWGGADVGAARATKTPLVRSLGSMTVVPFPASERTGAEPRPGESELARDTAFAPLVIGVIEGEDPKLKNEYILFSAHLDPLGPDAADDNASGVAGLLALARAFHAPGVHPRRSIALVATSGAADDFAGANFLCGPPYSTAVNCRTIVANITLDMIGRRAGDSITVDGAGDLGLATTPQWLLAAHPELRLHLTSGELRYTPESDYFAFARHGVPSLYFHNGSHPARPAPGVAPESVATSTRDPVGGLDPELEARILRLVFYVGRGLADAEHRPKWTPEGRRRRLALLGNE